MQKTYITKHVVSHLCYPGTALCTGDSILPNLKQKHGLLVGRWEECIYKAKLTAGRHGSATFKIPPTMQVLQKKSILSLGTGK